MLYYLRGKIDMKVLRILMIVRRFFFGFFFYNLLFKLEFYFKLR